MRTKLKIFVPVIIVGLGALAALAMIKARPKVETRPPQPLPPLVRVLPVHREDVQLTVYTQGTVKARTESQLIPEVSGRVVWISAALVSGGFFETDDVLLRIDPHAYELAVERAAAAVARRESESALAKTNLKRRRALAEQEVISEAVLDEAENTERIAAAALREAKAALAQARRDLTKTGLRAPFVGRIREETVDVGQFVVRGTPVATVYAVDFAEVRLPIPDDQLAFLDLPIQYRGRSDQQDGPPVTLTARFAGQEHTWNGRIVRTEGEIDPKNRMVYAVAQVENPYARGGSPNKPPLAVGLFVQAEIFGHQVHDVVVLPRAALRGKDQVLVVDADNHIRFRMVEVLRIEGEQVIVRTGLKEGERICLSSLGTAVDGMRVRTLDAPAENYG